MSSRQKARGGSPIVKTVFHANKRKLSPVVGPPDDTSEWRTSAQSTLDESSSVDDWFEGDVDTDGNDPEEEYDLESPEQLREAVLHHPVHLHPALQAVGSDLKLQLARSPAVESLGDLLDIKPRKYKLLNSPHQDSTSSLENFTLTLPSKKSSVMSSTVVVGDEKKHEMVVDDISAIKTRKSLDPRLSFQPFKKEGVTQGLIGKLGGHVSLGVSATNKMSKRQSRLLSSTPARSYQNKLPVIQSSCGSFELSSIHSSEAGGSMLVPRVEREMITEERVEETDSDDDENWYSRAEHQDTKQLMENTNKTASSSPSQVQSPPSSIVIPDTESETFSGHTTSSSFLCQYPPPPHAGGIRLTIPDYRNKGTFLNDIIIDFYLHYLFREKLSSQWKENIFIFSSYFFKRLSTEPKEGTMMGIVERDAKLSLAQKRHQRVQNWTKTTKLSLQQLVIFPICNNSHWFLVTAVMISNKSFLVVMDSLEGDRKEEVDMINEYLVIQLDKEQGENSCEEVHKMEVVQPCLPQQDNYTDCGLFLLHYVEEMFERPEEIICLQDQDLAKWFPKSEVAIKRSSIAELIRHFAKDQALAQSADIPAFPGLIGEEEEDVRENLLLKLVASEKEVMTEDISAIIKTELSNLSPSANRSRSRLSPDSSVVRSRLPSDSRKGRKRLSSDSSDGRSRLSSLDTSGEIFSLVVHKNQVRTTLPCPPIGRDRVGGSRARGKKRFRLATRQPQPAMSLFSKAEYYRGKQSSEMKFDMLMEEEENKKARVFSQ